MIMSIMWIWCISNILVDIIKTFGVIFGIPDSFLGMTLLAFGNSIPGKFMRFNFRFDGQYCLGKDRIRPDGTCRLRSRPSLQHPLRPWS